jgi:hypothetical protein
MRISQKLNYSIWCKLLLFVPLLLLLYAVMAQYKSVSNFGGTLREAVSLKTFIDDWIPLNMYLIYPYTFCVFYVPLSGILYAFYRNISAIQLVSYYSSIIGIYLFCYCIYLIFPTTAKEVMVTSFQPYMWSESMFRSLQDIYAYSTPLGEFPSLHVAPMVFLSLFLYEHWRILFWIVLPFAFLGAIGTVLLKFHVFVGFAWGGVVGHLGYYILYQKIFLPYFTKFITVKEQ